MPNSCINGPICEKQGRRRRRKGDIIEGMKADNKARNTSGAGLGEGTASNRKRSFLLLLVDIKLAEILLDRSNTLIKRRLLFWTGLESLINSIITLINIPNFRQ